MTQSGRARTDAVVFSRRLMALFGVLLMVLSLFSTAVGPIGIAATQEGNEEELPNAPYVNASNQTYDPDTSTDVTVKYNATGEIATGDILVQIANSSGATVTNSSLVQSQGTANFTFQTQFLDGDEELTIGLINSSTTTPSATDTAVFTDSGQDSDGGDDSDDGSGGGFPNAPYVNGANQTYDPETSTDVTVGYNATDVISTANTRLQITNSSGDVVAQNDSLSQSQGSLVFSLPPESHEGDEILTINLSDGSTVYDTDTVYLFAGGGGDFTPPTLSNATAIDRGDGDGNVSDGDSVEVIVNVSDSSGVGTVTAAAGDFGGASSLELTQIGETNRYNATFSVDESKASFNDDYNISITANDTAGNENITQTNALTLDISGNTFQVYSENIKHIDGTDPGKAPELDIFYSGGLVQVQLKNNSAGYELQDLGADRNSTWEISFTSNTPTPRILLGTGHNLSWTRTQTSNGNWTISIEVSPAEVHHLFVDGTTDVNYDGSRQANTWYNQTVQLAIDPVNGLPEQRRDDLNGSIMGTDAGKFGTPQYDEQNNSIRLLVENPHFTVNGKNNTGFFDTLIPDAQLNAWGVNDASELDVTAIGSDVEPTNTTDVPEGIRLYFPVNYSSGDIAISPAQTGGDGTVSGTVTNSSGSPVSGAIVEVLNPRTNVIVGQTTTDSTGSYSLSVSAGTYQILVDDYPEHEFEIKAGVQVQQSTTTTADIQLAEFPEKGTITGTVVDPDGQSVSGASVSARDLGYRFSNSTTTESDGSFSLKVPASNYTLRADAGGQSNLPPRTIDEVTVAEDETTNIGTITLPEPAYISGTVSNASGPVQGVTVIADGPDGIFPGFTKSDGSYNITVPPGNYSASVFARGEDASSKDVTATGGSTTTADFTLRETKIVHSSVEVTAGSSGVDTNNIGIEAAVRSGLLQVKLTNESASTQGVGGPPDELEGLGVDGSTEFTMNLTVTNFTANSLMWGVGNATWSTSENTTVQNGTDITVTGTAVDLQVKFGGKGPAAGVGPLLDQDPSNVNWPTGRSDRATDGRNQTVYFGIFDLGNVPGTVRNNLNGMSVTTNAQRFSAPRVVNQSLRVWIAAPTKTVDGADHGGFYKAEIPDAQLNEWGVDDPETELTALYKGDPANFTVTDTESGAEILLENISYSAGTVEVTAQTTDNVTASFTYSPSDPLTGETITFNASNSSANAGIDTYQWDFDDDGTYEATGEVVTHSFEDDDSYTVTLNVTDNDGNASETSTTIEVTHRQCFIATAAFGTPYAEEIDILRDYRDGVLRQHDAGQVLVTSYYTLSPPIAEAIGATTETRLVVRELFVSPLVALVSFGYASSMGLVLAGLAGLAVIGLGAKRRLRRDGRALYTRAAYPRLAGSAIGGVIGVIAATLCLGVAVAIGVSVSTVAGVILTWIAVVLGLVSGLATIASVVGYPLASVSARLSR